MSCRYDLVQRITPSYHQGLDPRKGGSRLATAKADRVPIVGNTRPHLVYVRPIVLGAGRFQASLHPPRFLRPELSTRFYLYRVRYRSTAATAHLTPYRCPSACRHTAGTCPPGLLVRIAPSRLRHTEHLNARSSPSRLGFLGTDCMSRPLLWRLGTRGSAYPILGFWDPCGRPWLDLCLRLARYVHTLRLSLQVSTAYLGGSLKALR